MRKRPGLDEDFMDDVAEVDAQGGLYEREETCFSSEN